MNDRLGCVGENDDFRLVVDLVRVREALTVGLDAAAGRYGRFVAVPHDFYWSVLEPAADREPGTGLASLVDDYVEGCEVLAMTSEERAALAWHALDHLGGLLSVLGELDGVEGASPEQIRASGQDGGDHPK